MELLEFKIFHGISEVAVKSYEMGGYRHFGATLRQGKTHSLQWNQGILTGRQVIIVVQLC